MTSLAVHRYTDAPIDFSGRVAVNEWVSSLPAFEGRRPRLTCNGYLYLLRHMLDGGEVPYYADPIELWRDVLLAHANETGELARTLELARIDAARSKPTVDRLWSLVLATGKRKTMRTDDVRAALEAGRG